MKHLDPTRVVPDRVRSALDSLASGLLLIDNEERIVLANEAFAEKAHTSREALQGRCATELPWAAVGQDEALADLPWQETLAGQGATEGTAIRLQVDDEKNWIFLVNSSPIVDETGQQQGAIASFDDVTALENKKSHLVRMVAALKESQEAVRKQNQQLHRLATRDELTDCLNRRAFFEILEMQWAASTRYGVPLSCIMVDVDHFKAVNDQHGHAKGDEVLRGVGKALQQAGRDSDIVARYGGEEFCVLLSNTDLEEAIQCAERLRKRISSFRFGDVSVTVSLGVSSRSLGAEKSQQLLEEADQSLYNAKHSGRNRVASWESIRDNPAQQSLTDKFPDVTPDALPTEAGPSIPFHAVTALVSALSFRDANTAAHSARVADLCAAMAYPLMPITDAYVLETAALLHDIGKMGVPDAVLLKPGELTSEEWKLMRLHERIGTEIIESSFANPRLTEIVQWHHLPFRDTRDDGAPRQGEQLPLGARILAIADAYDSIVTDQVYRQGSTPAEAFAELRRCAGTQFDPQLVEQFVQVVGALSDRQTSARHNSSRRAALEVGTQIERLAEAVDDKDYVRLRSLSQRLSATARKNALPEIGSVAQELATLAVDEPDLAAVIQTTQELLDLCRQTQRSYIDVEPDINARVTSPAISTTTTAGPALSAQPR